MPWLLCSVVAADGAGLGGRDPCFTAAFTVSATSDTITASSGGREWEGLGKTSQ